jgi:hypothetical protein
MAKERSIEAKCLAKVRSIEARVFHLSVASFPIARP